jgi:6-phosphofructokinase 1
LTGPRPLAGGRDGEFTQADFEIQKLGAARVASPMDGVRFVRDEEHALYESSLEPIRRQLGEGREPFRFELAGPRARIYFDPSKLKCGIVTCGGLCPGMNDVIRAIVMSLHWHYGVRSLFGFQYGFEGLTSKYGHPLLELNPKVVGNIHEMGGTILGTSRGPQDPADIVDTLERMNLGVLFTLGGDGPLRGAPAIAQEIARRGLKIAVVGVPKTIDNDISFIQTSFGFETAVSEARRVTYGAHSEAAAARNGVALVRLMGRESGFIAAYATLADSQVNFCLVPEVSFSLDAFLEALERRLAQRGHALVVASEGAGQDLMQVPPEVDASGNRRLGDIGLFLRERIQEHFAARGIEINMKYMDPSYAIRSLPANAHDGAFCLLLGHSAAHAAMAGRTDMIVGHWRGEFTHVPIPLAVSRRKQIDPDGWLWSSVVASTGQPGSLRRTLA